MLDPRSKSIDQEQCIEVDVIWWLELYLLRPAMICKLKFLNFFLETAEEQCIRSFMKRMDFISCFFLAVKVL